MSCCEDLDAAPGAVHCIPGKVLLPDRTQEIEGARLHILLEDTGRLDARARPLAEYVVHQLTETQLDLGEVGFCLTYTPLTPEQSGSIRAHLDVDRDGVVSQGDFLTTVHVPVSDDPRAAPVELALTKIGP